MSLPNAGVVARCRAQFLRQGSVLLLAVVFLSGLFVAPWWTTRAALLKSGWQPTFSALLAAHSARAQRVLARVTGGRVFAKAAYFGPIVGLTKALTPATPTSFESGKPFKYRLSWRCAGSVSPQDDCFNMKITDLLPLGIELVNAPVAAPITSVTTAPSGSQQLVTINFEPQVAAGVAGIIDLEVRYVPGATPNGTTSTNTAQILADVFGGGSVNATSNPVTTSTTAVDQTSAAKTLSYGGAAGDLSSYNIRVCSDKDGNGQGYLDYTNVTITDTLPSGADYVSASPTPDSTTGGVIVWNVAKINASCQTFNVVVRYPSPLFVSGNSVTNNAHVTGTLTNGTVVTYTPAVTHTLTAPGPNSSISKSASSADKSAPDQVVGSDVNYTISIRNTGNVTIDQLVEDALPNELNLNRINTGAAAVVEYQKNGVATWIPGVTLGSAVDVNGTNFPGFVNGDYVSRLSFRFNGVIPNVSNSVGLRATIVNPANGSGTPYTPPANFNNQATIQTIHENVVASTKSDDAGFEIVPPTPTVYPQSNKAVIGGSQVVPASIIEFRVRAQAGNSTNATTFYNPVLVDLLPANLEFVQTTALTQSGGASNCTTLPSTPQIITNYNNTGRALLVWNWTGQSPQCTLPPSGIVSVQYQARVKAATAPGNFTNTSAVVSLEGSGGTFITKKRFCASSSGLYPDDPTGALGVVIDPTYKCEASPAGYEVLSSFQVASRKGVMGQLNNDGNPATDDFFYSGTHNVAQTVRGGTMRWSMEITNQGNIPATNLDVLDILPFNAPSPGNTGVGTGQAMGSTWRPFFLTPIDVSTAPPGTKVYYTTDANPCRPTIVDVTGCQSMTLNAAGVPQTAPGQWSDVFPEDPTIIRSIRIIFGNYVLQPGTTFRFEWPMSAPDDAPLATAGTDNTLGTDDDTEIAWNTFGYSVTRTDTSESVSTAPTRVGIEVAAAAPNLASYGNYVWQDVNRNGIQDEALTGSGAKGINGVRVELWTDGDGNDATTNDQQLWGIKLTATDSNGNPGYYLFPSLPPGSYFARFYPPGDYLAASPPNAGGSTEANDSDGIEVTSGGVTYFQSHLTTLVANQQYVDTDQGFYYQIISLGNTVFFDTNNDGQISAGEAGPNGVLVELFRDANNSGVLEDLTAIGGVNELLPIARQLTSNGGYYLFTQQTDSAGVGLNTPLKTGRYFAGVSRCNFGSTSGCPATIGGQTFTAGALKGYWSSGTVISNAGAISESAIVGNGTTDSDQDNFDESVLQSSGFYSGGVLSGAMVFVKASTEPTNENTRSLGANGLTPGLNNTVDGSGGGQPITDADSNLTVDFGFYQQCLGDIVFHDDGAGTPGNANNGLRDAGELGIGSVALKLYAQNGTTEIPVGPDGILGTSDDTTGATNQILTNAGAPLGAYQFCGLPSGQYLVRLTVPTGATSSVDVATTANPDNYENSPDDDNGIGQLGGTVASGVITLTPGTANVTENITASGSTGTTTNPTLDFGLLLTPPISIGNTVWFDTNNDSAINAGEQGIDGVLVELFFDTDGNGSLAGAEQTPVARQLTSGGGYYLFTQTTNAAGVGLGGRLGASTTNRYFVGIAPYNFSTGLAGQPATIGGSAFTAGLLAGYTSSGTTIANNGVVTDATPLGNTNNDGDNVDDSRRQSAATQHPFYAVSAVYGVMSGGLIVSVNSEPSAALSNSETTQPANLANGLTPPNNPALGYPLSHFNTVEGTASGQPIQDDESNLTVDFGFYRQCLGDIVFSDDGGGVTANYNNGVRDAGENGLKEVIVKLFAADGTTEISLGPDGIWGTADDTTGATNQLVTNTTGAYQFCGLPSGSFVVRITIPLGYKSSQDVATTANPNNFENTPEDDNGPGTGGGFGGSPIFSNAITLTPGTVNAPESVTATASNGTTNNPTLDFGCRPEGFALGNAVWYDTNNNGQLDASERGLDGVKVELFLDANSNNALDSDEQTPIATQWTSGGGFYLFTQTTNSAGVGTAIPLLPGKYFVGIVAANFVVGAPLFGLHSSATTVNNSGALTEVPVAANQNSDNDQDNYDDGLKQAASFYAGGVLSGVVNLVPASEPQNETTAGQPGATGGNTPGHFNTIDGLVGGPPILDFNSNVTVDFGFYTASLGNLVFDDKNNTGRFDGVDVAFPNIGVRLFAQDGVTLLGSRTTDGQGRYLFEDLAQGRYFLEIDVPTGYVSSQDIANPNDPESGVDNDDNGVGTSFGATTARSNQITLTPGAEPVNEFDNPQPINGKVDDTPDIDAEHTLDFGLTRIYSLGNRIWKDVNNNGVIDAPDGATPGLDNIRVRLLSESLAPAKDAAGNAVAEQLTRHGGYYRFDNLAAGNYIVEVMQANFQANGPLHTWLSSTGTNAATGAYEPAPDPDEPGGQGIDSDDNGAGSSSAVRSQAVTLGNDGSQGSDDGHSEPTNETDFESPHPPGEAPGDQSNLTVDFGFFPPLSLGNLVWKDLNNNGFKEANEDYILGVTVRLYADNGDNVFNAATDTLLQTDVTDSVGVYAFEGLYPGNYFVHLPSSNFGAGNPLDLCLSSTVTESDPNLNVDTNDNGLDSPTPQTTGITSGLVNLQANAEPDVAPAPPPNDEDGRNGNTTVDFGFYKPLALGNLVWKDLNNDGQRQLTEPGVDGVTVELFLDRNNSGSFEPTGGDAPVFQTTTTANGGLYLFSDLVPGAYFVRVASANFVAPNGRLVGCISSSTTEPNPDTDRDNDDNGVDEAAPPTNGISSGKVTIAANGEPDNPVDGDGPSSNLTVDFGFYGQVSLGNLVWKDLNNDGQRQLTEPGIDGVTVELFSDRNGNNALDGADAPAVTTTLTANGGTYNFNGLTPGNYFVRLAPANFTAPNGVLLGWVSSTTSDPTPNNDEDNDDNGVDDANPATNGLASGVVTLASMSEPTSDGDDANGNQTVDFGFFPPLALGNLVWKDFNNDGVRQPGEPGVDSVTVELYRDNGDGQFTLGLDALQQTKTTSGGGLYQFTGLLPGSYFVRLPANNFTGAGALVNCFSSTVTASDPNNDVDNDDNGVDNAAPQNNGIVSNRVTLAGDSEPDTAIDGDGRNANETVDFGFYSLLCVGNLVWRDYDNSGTRQISEPGVDGVTVELFLDRNNNGSFEPSGADAPRVNFTTTASGGVYKFCGLAPGNYFVRLPASNFQNSSLLKDWVSSTVTTALPNSDVDNDDNGLDVAAPETVGLASGLLTLSSGNEPDTAVDGDDRNSNLTVDFGFFQPLTLGNLVWKDFNNDGVRQNAQLNVEPGVDGVLVELLRDANNNGALDGGEFTAIATQTTSGGGFYKFTNLLPGQYFVRVAAANFQPNGALFGCFSSTVTEAQPDTDRDNDDNGLDGANLGVNGVYSGVTTLTANGEPDTAVDGDGRSGNLTVDFGFYAPVTLGNLVWKDFNNDGQRQAGEPGVDGVRVELLADANNNATLDAGELAAVATQITVNGGFYQFAGLVPGNYFVRVAAANFTANGGTNGGPGALLNCFSSTPSDATPNNDEDNDDNGLDNAQPSTNGILSGVVTVLANSEPLANVDGDDANGNLTVDFGFYAPLTLGNLVWKDFNNDGFRDVSEPGVDGVAVELFSDRNGNQQFDAVADAPAVQTQTTTGGGLYQFAGLPPGNYFVRVAPTNFASPSGVLLGCASSTPSDATPNNDEDNDDNGIDNPNPQTNGIPSGLITLVGSSEPTNDGDDANGNQTVDFGFYTPLRLGNVVWKDFDNNGRQDAGEPGINGVVLELLRDANGNDALDSNEVTALATQTTAGGGFYQFTNLLPGKYFVRVAATNFTANGALANWTSSTPTSATPNDNVDKDDNGVDHPQPQNNGIASGVVTLVSQDEPDTPADGDDRNGNLTLDFGFVPSLALGNLVWQDFNNDGLRQAGEPGVNGVLVELFRDANNSGALDANDGAALATRTTSGGGFYKFDGLLPGNYLVRLAPANFGTVGALFGLSSSTPTSATPNNDTDNDDNGIDNAAPPTSGITSGVVSLSGESEPDIAVDTDDRNGNLTVDFGFYAPLRLGNLVWKDYDNDGQRDISEPGVNGVTVELLRDANGNGTLEGAELTAVASQTTSGGGFYKFENLTPGRYAVRLPAPNFQANGALAGWLSSTPTSATPNSNTDNDDNGLDNATPESAGIVTALIELASFDEPTNDGDDNNGNLTLDLGFIPRMALGNLVWKDLNNNGGKEANEPAVNGVLLELLRDVNGNGVLDAGELAAIATQTTANGGLYKFENLTPGGYFVRVAATNFQANGALAGWTSSTPTESDPNADVDTNDNGLDNANPQSSGIVSNRVTLIGESEPSNDGDNPNGNLTVDFGFTPLLRLGNLVWRDVNNDGQRQPGEVGVSGVLVELFRDANSNGFLDDGAALAAQTTSADGFYQFTGLLPGSYFVRLAASNFTANGVLYGWQSSTPTATDANSNLDNDDNGLNAGTPATDGVSSSVVHLSGEDEPDTAVDTDDRNGNLTVDFGFYPLLVLGNLVWKDANNDGLRQPGEAPVDGVLLELYRDANSNGQFDAGDGAAIAAQTTAGGGFYKFTNLTPGGYFVRVSPQSFQPGGALAGCLSSTASNAANEANPNSDVDNDDNGIDAAAPASTGVSSRLVTLSGNGEPDTAVDTDDRNGNLTVDFGFYMPLVLGNLVWLDFNNNGWWEAGEPGVDGVTVELFSDVNGSRSLDATDYPARATMTTSGGGFYQFKGLKPGSYFVRVAPINFQPGGLLANYFSSTVTQADTNTDFDSDDNGMDDAVARVNGICASVVDLSSFSEPTNDGDDYNGNETVDFGFAANTLRLGNLVWKDTNRNSLREAGEPGVGNVTLNLYRDTNGNGTFEPGTDAFVAATTTNASGLYGFDNLAPGGYFVQVPTSNFGAGAPLYGLASSADIANPNNDVDNDDNGSDSLTPLVNPPTSRLVTLGTGQEPVNDGDDGNGNQTVDFGFVTLTTLTVEDPATCVGPGTVLTVRAQVTNASLNTQPDNPGPELVATLPASVIGMPGSCTISGAVGTCTVTATQVVFNGVIPAGGLFEAVYKVQIAPGVTNGTQFCITSTANFDADLNGTNESSASINYCDVVNCQQAGPGIAINSGCSVLLYQVYTSSATDPNVSNTRVTLTNTHTSQAVAVHLFFVDGATCSVSDAYLCLTQNQTTAFLMSDLDPGTTGYLVAVAVDRLTGCPINFNYLLGDAAVKFDTGHWGNLPAQCATAVSGDPGQCRAGQATATLNFDAERYSRMPRAVAVDSLSSRADGNDALLVVNRLNGNLSTGLDKLGNMFGLLYDDAERGVSFTLNPSSCQIRARIDNNFPRTTPRFEQLIPAGRTGWMRFWASADEAIFGAVFNRNPNHRTATSAYEGAHQLHTLTTTGAASVTIPVFPPTCQ